MSSTHDVSTSTSQHASILTHTDIELLQNTGAEPSAEDQGFSLPPTDGGKDAWLCLFACFMLEALIWGFPSCYGVFQEY
ncbi:hypothetical protein NX059_004326 [Plenodomus lindquistii]|nr:hypothetical protein NX059_004326 [Plenodomus lindquistii]